MVVHVCLGVRGWREGGDRKLGRGGCHLSIVLCTFSSNQRWDRTKYKLIVNASNRGEGMSHPRETFYTWQIFTLLILSMSPCMNLWKDDNARDESWPSRNNYIVSMHMQYIRHRIGQQSFYLHVMLSKPFHHVNVHNMVQENGEMRNF